MPSQDTLQALLVITLKNVNQIGPNIRTHTTVKPYAIVISNQNTIELSNSDVFGVRLVDVHRNWILVQMAVKKAAGAAADFPRLAVATAFSAAQCETICFDEWQQVSSRTTAIACYL